MRQIHTVNTSRRAGEEGAAVASALLVMLLMAAVTAGFTALVITDTRVRALDNTRTQAFYAVQAGLEKMTADLGDLFASNVAPTATQINAIGNAPPSLTGVTWTKPDGTDGYSLTFPVDGAGNPAASVTTVNQGPFAGLVGLATSYTMSTTAHVADGSETSFTRVLQTVAIPIFQFGIFSENDLSFFAGPDFDFGGRVHTNSNLFLAEGDGKNLWMRNNVTAVGEVIRTNLSNGWATTTNYNGIVNIINGGGNGTRALARTEGSQSGLVGPPTSAEISAFSSISSGAYAHHLMNGRTGARLLQLPIAQFGATPIDLIKRAPANEDVNAPNVLAQRFFSLASLRILLADTQAEITSLPGVTAAAPVSLAAIPGAWAVSSNANTPLPPFGVTAPAGTFGVRTAGAGNLPLLSGFIKIERQSAAGVWTDVTLEILRLGFDSPAYTSSAIGSAMCADLTPNAVIRLQRVLDNAGACYTLANTTTAASAPTRHVENVLFDPREGSLRDSAPVSMEFGGLMYYVELDGRNLARWFRQQIPAANCAIACTGNQAWNLNGYTVYFSDRRSNAVVAGSTTGEYGFEDVVNRADSAGIPNGGAPEVGEDVNLNNVLDVYGEIPIIPASANANMIAPFVAAARPWTMIDPGGALTAAENAAVARRNPPIFFRRALKISNGADLSGAAPGLTGLTIASENPVYLQGDWNKLGADFDAGTHVATAILADSLTLLSNNWNDWNSLMNPYVMGAGQREVTSDTWYRVAVIAGKTRAFLQPTWGAGQDFGTDGGAHNFLRYIEDWGGQTLNYRGSIASMFYSRQATGTYKCCTIVYSPPTRGYNFDTEFLTPSLLPPRTPMFRDVNITGFAQVIRPN